MVMLVYACAQLPLLLLYSTDYYMPMLLAGSRRCGWGAHVGVQAALGPRPGLGAKAYP